MQYLFRRRLQLLASCLSAQAPANWPLVPRAEASPTQGCQVSQAYLYLHTPQHHQMPIWQRILSPSPASATAITGATHPGDHLTRSATVASPAATTLFRPRSFVQPLLCSRLVFFFPNLPFFPPSRSSRVVSLPSAQQPASCFLLCICICTAPSTSQLKKIVLQAAAERVCLPLQRFLL